ncbi:MAG: TIGR03943 family putative permease subunit [Prochlorotrichaceae cyanobacterium]|jgi:uncharacterized repeat protein (TIGR03943 family)
MLKSPYPLWLRGLALIPTGLWGVLLLRYWHSGDLNLLIHPAYHGLTIVTGLILLMLTTAQLLTFFKPTQAAAFQNNHPTSSRQLIGIIILSVVAIAGFLIPPRVFASSLSTDRPVTDFLTLARVEPEAFRTAIKPEDRTIVDWVRTLNVYPEPDAYEGDAVDVEGFVLHPEELPEQYLMAARFIITCCAADVYPVGLPVELGTVGTRQDYPVDGWIRIQGRMATAIVNDQRKAIIRPDRIETIPEPDNPYAY